MAVALALSLYRYQFRTCFSSGLQPGGHGNGCLIIEVHRQSLAFAMPAGKVPTCNQRRGSFRLSQFPSLDSRLVRSPRLWTGSGILSPPSALLFLLLHLYLVYHNNGLPSTFTHIVWQSRIHYIPHPRFHYQPTSTLQFEFPSGSSPRNLRKHYNFTEVERRE